MAELKDKHIYTTYIPYTDCVGWFVSQCELLTEQQSIDAWNKRS